MPSPLEFSPQQMADIRKEVERNNSEILDAVRQQVSRSVEEMQAEILARMPGVVEQAVKDNQKVFISSVGQSPDAGDKKGWKLEATFALVPAVIQTLLTFFLGFLIWHWQSGIQKGIDDNSKFLTTKLSLKEEYFKRKLTVYENVHAQLAGLGDSLEKASVAKEEEEPAAEKLEGFHDYTVRNKLYIPDQLYSRLDNIRLTALGVLSHDKKSSIAMFQQEVSNTVAEMSAELEIDDLGQITPRTKKEGAR